MFSFFIQLHLEQFSNAKTLIYIKCFVVALNSNFFKIEFLIILQVNVGKNTVFMSYCQTYHKTFQGIFPKFFLCIFSVIFTATTYRSMAKWAKCRCLSFVTDMSCNHILYHFWLKQYLLIDWSLECIIPEIVFLV